MFLFKPIACDGGMVNGNELQQIQKLNYKEIEFKIENDNFVAKTLIYLPWSTGFTSRNDIY